MDTEEGALEDQFNTSDLIDIDTSEYASYDYVDVKVTKADGSAMMMIEFYPPYLDEEFVLPAGTYDINSSEQSWSVYACHGMSYGTLYPSFYTALTETGEAVEPFWYMVEGEVTVKHEGGSLSIEVNAENSYGLPIHITYGMNTVGLDNLNDGCTETIKSWSKGSFNIVRGGSTYNVLGQEVK